MRRAVLPLVLLALLVLVLTAPVAASPQPMPICGPCGGGLERATVGERTGELDVRAGTAAIRLHEDGSATWHVTTQVGNETAAAHLRDHPEDLDRLVSEAVGYSATDGDFQDIDATIDGTTITTTFEDPDAARRMNGGILVNEYFHSRGYDTRWVLTADSITVVGPPGTVVTNDPAGAEVNGRNATWRGDPTERLGGAPLLEADAYVAYGDGGTGSQLWTTVDLWLATMPIVLDVVTRFYVVPLGLFGLLIAGAVSVGRRDLAETRFSVSRVSGAVAGLGAVLTVASMAEGILPIIAGTQWGIGVGPVYLAFGFFGLWRGAKASPRDLLAIGFLTLVGVTAIQLVFLPPTVATRTFSARVTAMEVVRLLPFVIAPTVGAVAVHRSRRRAGIAWLAMVGAFLAFQLSVVWPTQRPWGLAIVLFLLAVFIVTVGVLPLFVFGSTVTESTGAPDSP